MSKGCGDSTCTFKLCASCCNFKPISNEMIPILSFQLASRPKLLLCPRVQWIPMKELDCIQMIKPSNASSSSTATHPHLFFLSSMLSTPSFSNLFDQNETNSDGYSSDGNGNESFEWNECEQENPIESTQSQIASNGNGLESLPISLFDLKLKNHQNLDKVEKSIPNLLDISKKLNSQESLLLKDTKQGSYMAKRALNEHLEFPKSQSTDSLTSLASTEFSSCSSFQPLNKSLFYKHLKLYQQEPISSRLVLDSIGFTFSSRTFLSQSFSDSDSKLDLDFLYEFYDICLHQLEPKHVFQKTFLDALEILLSKLSSFNARSIEFSHSIESTRIILILLANPLLKSREHDEIIMRKLCRILGSLKSTVLLEEWLSVYSAERLSEIIHVFKDYLSHSFFPGPKPDASVFDCMNILKIFFKINLVSNLVDISEFYCASLCQKLHFKAEFKAWKSNIKSYFDYPFLFDPISKTRIMRLDGLYQMSEEFEQAYVSQSLIVQAQKFLQDSDSVTDLEKKLVKAANPFLVLEIKRDQLIADTISQLQSKEKDLKKPIRIKFVHSGEEGMDQGGVQKEFFQCILSHLMDPSYGLFTYDTETRLSWIPSCVLEESKLYYELFGVLLGLALYNGIMLGISFPLIFYKKLLSFEITFTDFKDSFPSLGNGLTQLLDWKGEDVEFVFCRNFEITIEEFGELKTVELKPIGETIPVTHQNRQEFVDLYYKYYCTTLVQEPFDAIRKGFLKVCQGRALNVFLIYLIYIF